MSEVLYDYDYDYDYEMLLLRHKEIQYNMSELQCLNTVIANTFLSIQITYTMHRAYK